MGSLIRHGHSRALYRTKIYEAWRAMFARCYNPNHISYKNYGGRDIKVCIEWRKSFTKFLVDIGLPPTPKHTLDRIDNNGDYEPGNVKWSTRSEQQYNKRRSKK
jgi:hypothetical protein